MAMLPTFRAHPMTSEGALGIAMAAGLAAAVLILWLLGDPVVAIGFLAAGIVVGGAAVAWRHWRRLPTRLSRQLTGKLSARLRKKAPMQLPSPIAWVGWCAPTTGSRNYSLGYRSRLACQSAKRA